MDDNLAISRGLIVAEAVMMGLAPQIGRQEAHDVVYDACRLANEKGLTLADALSADPRVSARIDRATIDRADLAEKLSRPCARHGRPGAEIGNALKTNLRETAYLLRVARRSRTCVLRC